MPERLEIHIIGAGIGESIIIGFSSENAWGVIDAYSSNSNDPDTNPTIKFLQRREVKQLEFVALTHPHDDHYRGLASLFDVFSVNSFWQFDGISPAQLSSFLKLADDPIEDYPALIRLFNTVKEKGIRRQTMAPSTVLYPYNPASESHLKITSLAPSGKDREKYLVHVGGCYLDGAFVKKYADRIDHNLISTALSVQFGDFNILLGGDVETEGWEQIVERYPEALQSNLVKVSHHGSTNGYCVDMWKKISPTNLAYAVITPYSRKRLPAHEGLAHIRAHSRALFVTATNQAIDKDKLIDFSFEEEMALQDLDFDYIEPLQISADSGHQNTYSCYFYLNGEVQFDLGAGVTHY